MKQQMNYSRNAFRFKANADYEFSDCWGFINGDKLTLVDENNFSSGSYYFRHDNTNGRIYLTDDDGNETFKEIVN